jgi:hypothetical protein
MQNIGRAVDSLLDLWLCEAGHAQSEAHVLFDCHVRVKRVGLKNHRDAPRRWLHVVDNSIADPKLAIRQFLETRYHPKEGRFAATGGTHKHDKFSVQNFEINAVDDLDLTESFDYLSQG